MKKIIITGKDSYIGNHIQSWILFHHPNYRVEQVDVISDEWKNADFRGADVVIHVAALVHKTNIRDWELYKKVNVDLPRQVAEKAKAGGARQFIFMSTMAVYGAKKKLRRNTVTSATECVPRNMYAKSKLLAEKLLFELSDTNFRVSAVRPPNVYGYACKGNYITGFLSAVKRMPAIPAAYEHVHQSMLYIDNLTELIRLIIERNGSGIYTPQDKVSVCSTDLMRLLSNNRKRVSRLLGLGVYLLSFLPVVRKAYGGVEYAEEMSSHFNGEYQIVSIEEGIERTLQYV